MIELEIKFDGYSNDISWSLTDECTNSLVARRGYKSNESFDHYTACVLKGKYVFPLNDSFGDGFSYPCGSATVTYSASGESEAKYEVKDSFGLSAESSLGNCDSRNIE